MLTINIYLKFALIAVGLIGGIALWATMGVWYGIWFVILGLVMLATYIFLGTVQSAAEMLQQSDFEGANERLNLTLKPEWLYATNRAYFYMIKGSTALAQKNVEEGEKWLKKAEEVEVPTDNERAMLQLQLANIAASKGRWKQAERHYRVAKGCKITEPNIKEQFNMFEKQFKNRGAAKQSGQMGGFRPGGKRRRPKMR
ncbi:tetratricopeptide repeat protein [Phaeodactylibacter xiamenensis]|jgi:tetratricopeptide (TPR) repeat protein|uniref:tetratricopeptide repeat protein n=1 Tax=Phaeodactylibacter xiamenensis TaxID=1524460 RepID=UPI0024A89E2E|nr:tetratricopeptide repeat protein [Phaeodactylibacter xiamenensis]